LLGFGIMGSVHAQRSVDLQNCREGESVEYCSQHKKLQEQLKDPVFKKDFEVTQAQLAEELSKNKGEIPSKGTIYRVPVVFHVLHNGGAENISREQIVDALNIWNRDYRRLNQDANNVHPDFQGMPTDVEIEFVMATKAPDGTCFSGITRTKSPLSYQGDNGFAQVNAISQGNDVFKGQWPGNKYLNIFVCGDIGGAAGYTNYPSGNTGMTNGIWVLHNYVGSIGTSSAYTSRTLTHEAGHWLNLPHCWGSTNNPGLASNCNTDDGVADTPNTIGVSSCNLNEATCGPRANVENYMDYSYCSKMFTAGQVARMRTAITSSTGGRSNVISANNIAATGADSNFTLCKAEFESDMQVICAGETVNFSDRSFNKVNGWTWSFPGGTPSSSTSQNPSVVYSTPGIYAVTLTAADGGTTTTTTKQAFVRVLADGIKLPYSENFENYTDFNAASSFFRSESLAGTKVWEVYTGAGSSGNKCVRLRNFSESAGVTSNLKTNNFDLSDFTSADQVTLSFKYAYRKKTSANNEILKIAASNNCGEIFSVRKTISNTSLSNQTSSSEWVPTAQDWVQVHITNVTSQYFVDALQLQFQFIGNGGNNIYLDDINFYEGDQTKLGLEDYSDIANLQLYPNPADDVVNIEFNVATSGKVVLEVTDLTGKIVNTEVLDATAGANAVIMGTNQLNQGMYLLNIKSGNIQKTIQFAVK